MKVSELKQQYPVVYQVFYAPEPTGAPVKASGRKDGESGYEYFKRVQKAFEARKDLSTS